MSPHKVDEAPKSARLAAQALYLVTDDAPPPSRSPASRRLGIPTYADELVGRTSELAALDEALAAGTRLITVRGPGGMGKTRLVSAWAARTARGGADVAFVPLAPLAASENVAAAVAVSLGLTVDPETDPADDVVRALRERATVLVLDNLEHLLGDGRLTRWLQSILDRAPRVRIMTTSRERLGLTAETVVELVGLGIPEDDLAASEAVQLFEKRARQVQSGFDIDAQRPAVLAICRLLEGIPLAIELAATWVRMLSSDEILSEIRKTLDFLTADPRSGRDARQSSMRAVFAQSWRLLREDEQQVLARLSIFRGGFDRVSAEHVARGSLPLLAALLDRSLVRARTDGPRTRYDMHELLRQFAAEQLGEAHGALALAHAEHFASLVQTLHPHLRGERQVETLEQLTLDLDNLRAALDFGMKSARYDLVARIAWALWPFWWIRNMQREGRRWMEALMPNVAALDLFWRTQATIAMGAMVYAQGDVEACVRYSHVLAELAAESGDPRPLAFAHGGFGLGATSKGDLKGAIEHLTKARELFVQAGDPGIAAQAAAWVATVNLYAGNLAAAETHATAALNEANGSGDRLASVSARYCLARIAIASGALAEAARHLLESIPPSLAIEDRGALSFVFELLGVLFTHAAAFECSATMFGASDAITRAIVHRGHTYYLPDTKGIEKARAATVERLGREAFERANAAGAEASVEALVALAADVPLDAPPAPLASAKALRLQFFEEDDSVFVEHEYLIKGVAGRLLWRMLHLHQTEGRSEFTNRELRLDAWLKLPAIRDNLEARLVLLEKRLEEKKPPFRIERSGRGRIRLVVETALTLDVTPAP